MNQLTRAIESLFGADGEDHCDVFLCSNEAENDHVYEVNGEFDKKCYCDDHFTEMTGIQP